MLRFFFGPHSCALASHIALVEADADYEAVRLNLVAGRSEDAGISEDQPEVPRARPGDRPRRAHREPGDPRLCRADPSAGESGAARRRLCLRKDPGLHRLSLRHGARRPCPWPARLPLGGPAILLRRHEAEGAGDHGPPASTSSSTRYSKAPGSPAPDSPSPIPTSSPSRAGWNPTGSIPSASPRCSTTATAWAQRPAVQRVLPLHG